jgi:hypothetical protein
MCGIISIILAGITYQYSGPDWNQNPWMHTPKLQVACIIYSFFLAFLGYIVFSKPNIALTITVNLK